MTLDRHSRSPISPLRFRLPWRVGRNRLHVQARQRTALASVVGVRLCLLSVSCLMVSSHSTIAQTAARSTGEEQKRIEQRLSGLRQLPDAERAQVTRQLALDIRHVASPAVRVGLASSLANLATEGDFGRNTLQEVATTLAEALRAWPSKGSSEQASYPYLTLAQLARYEHLRVSLDAPQFTTALAQLEAADRRREKVDFTLTDLQGKAWPLKALKGKVVVVNFWATWCPPCRKELPDLQALYDRFKGRGLVVLGITDEDVTKVQPFVTEHQMTYPVLLDPGRKVNKRYEVQGIPHTFFYDRSGKLAAQAIDMRTRKQFLELLGRAGLNEEKVLSSRAK